MTLRLPTPLPFAAWAGPTGDSRDVAVPVLGAEAMVTVRPTGQADRIALTQSSLVPAVDAAFTTALQAVVQDEGMPAPSLLCIERDFTLFVALTFEPAAGRATRSPLDSIVWARRTATQPIVRLQLPGTRFSAPAVTDAKRRRPPAYPSHLSSARLNREVTFEFIIGANGRVTPGTMRLLNATDRGFADAVFDALEKSRFLPGEIGGCAVAVLSRQAFEFRMMRE